MIFLSIVVPVHNRAELIVKTVESILNQKTPDLELILVDDGSTDSTLQVLRGLAKGDSRIRVLSKDHGERGAARNYGAARARGRYLIFFDSDDWMLAEHLQTIRQHILASGSLEVYYSSFEFRNSQGDFLGTVDVCPKDFKRQLYFNNFLACGSVVIRADIFGEFLFCEDVRLAACEDKELWLRVASRYPFHHVAGARFVLVEHSGRSLRFLTPQHLEQQTHLLIELLGRDEVFKKSFRFHRFLFAYELTAVSLAWSRHGQWNLSLSYLWRALRTSLLVVFTGRYLSAVKRAIGCALRYCWAHRWGLCARRSGCEKTAG